MTVSYNALALRARSAAVLAALLASVACSGVMAQAKPTPSNGVNPYIELGISYFEAGKYEIAMEEANKALAKEPQNADAHNLLGSVYLRLNDNANAEEEFKKALQIAPQNADALNNMGLVLCKTNRVDASLEFFGKALSTPRYPRAAQTLVNAGVCINKKQDYAASEKYFVKALEQEPFMPIALYQLALSYFKTGRSDMAESRIDALHKQISPNAASLYLLASIEQARGNNSKADQYRQRIASQFPQSNEARRIASGQLSL